MAITKQQVRKLIKRMQADPRQFIEDVYIKLGFIKGHIFLAELKACLEIANMCTTKQIKEAYEK